jgi:3'(2'), 5'-bisphosphate nucleotidase
MTDYKNLLKTAIGASIKAGEKTLEYFEKELKIETKEDNSPLTDADLESNNIINKLLKHTGIPILSEENKIIPYKERKAWNLFWMVDPLDGTKEFVQKSAEYTVNIALIENNKPVVGVIYVPVQKTLYYSTSGSGVFKVIANSLLSYSEIIKKSISLPIKHDKKDKIVIIASKSHMSMETKAFIEELRKNSGDHDLIAIGSSLKFCLMAEGLADFYPRFGPTMEWDTAAGQVIAESANCHLIDIAGGDLKYNKIDLYNPSFIAYNENYSELVNKLIL